MHGKQGVGGLSEYGSKAVIYVCSYINVRTVCHSVHIGCEDCCCPSMFPWNNRVKVEISRLNP